MLLGKNVKQCFLSKQFGVLYSESPRDFLVLLDDYACVYMYVSNRNRCCFSEKLCVLTSRLALHFCITCQSIRGLLKAKAHIFCLSVTQLTLVRKKRHLSHLWSCQLWLTGCMALGGVYSGAEDIHRLCLGCAQDILLLLTSPSSGAGTAYTLLCCLLICAFKQYIYDEVWLIQSWCLN